MPKKKKRRIEYMPVSELMKRLHPANPKGHDLEMIAQSFQDHGFVSSGTLDQRTGYFLCGHGRTEALQYMIDQQMDAPREIDQREDDWYCPVECGYESINDAQALAYLVIDNQATIAGDWDKQKLAELLTAVNNSEDIELPASGFDESQLKEIMTELANQQEPADDPGAQVDRAGELQEKWQVQRGDVWLVGAHRVMCGDSTCADDVARLMNDINANMVFADPPYGVSIGNKNKFLNTVSKGTRHLTNIKHDDLTPDKLKEILTQVFTITKSIMDDSASIYVTAPQGGELGMMMMMMSDAGLPIRHVLIWVKNQPTFSMSRLDYDYQHEPILYTWNKTHKFYGNGQFTKSIWPINKPQSSKYHATMKPPELVANAINNSTLLSDDVYDPFLGSGTTLVACEQTGRIGYGMEIAPEYVAVTLERLVGMGLTPALVENKNPVAGVVDGDSDD